MMTIIALIALLFAGSYAWSALNDICDGLESHTARWRQLLAQVLLFVGSFCSVLTALHALLTVWW